MILIFKCFFWVMYRLIRSAARCWNLSLLKNSFTLKRYTKYLYIKRRANNINAYVKTVLIKNIFSDSAKSLPFGRGLKNISLTETNCISRN